MIVTRQNHDKIVSDLRLDDILGFDTETYGLGFDDKLFSIIIYSDSQKKSFYFNYHPYEDLDLSYILPRGFIHDLRPIFEDSTKTIFAHNAKFDMQRLALEDIFIRGRVHDTMAIERIVKNNLMRYGLDACAQRRGHKKDSGLDQFFNKREHYEMVRLPWKKTKTKNKKFWTIPFPVIVKYGLKDGELPVVIGTDQIKKLKEQDTIRPIIPLFENEVALTKICFDMEHRGIKLDLSYTIDALAFETNAIEKSKKEFEQLTGKPFVDSPKALHEVFKAMGEPPPGRTEKGNPSFTKDLLSKLDTPLGNKIKEIRHHEKLSGYYGAFLHFADNNDIIHPTMRQSGTETGRFSYSDPNLQNVPKEDEGEFPYWVRKCFILRPDHCFVAIDYDQQEFRMLLDYAGEHELIAKVLDGADVHQATADMVGIDRKKAKTLNFALLYGMGNEKLASALKCSQEEAKTFRAQYFNKLPKVKAFINQVISIGERRRYIYNWAGRRCHISHKDYAYILPNHLIQGGGADVIKFAMTKLFAFLREKRTNILLQVHDELLFEVHNSELDIVMDIRNIMESVYKPYNDMKLTCSVEHSWKSWGACDKIKGFPNLQQSSEVSCVNNA